MKNNPPAAAYQLVRMLLSFGCHSRPWASVQGEWSFVSQSEQLLTHLRPSEGDHGALREEQGLGVGA